MRKPVTIILIVILFFLVSKYILTQVHLSKIIRNNELTELHYSLDSVIDLGNINKNSTINFFFYLKNTGHKTLYISDIGVTCGCTNVISNKSTALVGDSIKISGTIDAKNKHGKSITQLRFKANTMQQDHSVSLKYFCL